jgi:hypothetical protein
LKELDDYLENIPEENLQLSLDEIASFRNIIKKGAQKQFNENHFRSPEELTEYLVSHTSQTQEKTIQAKVIAKLLYGILEDAAGTLYFCMLKCLCSREIVLRFFQRCVVQVRQGQVLQVSG